MRRPGRWPCYRHQLTQELQWRQQQHERVSKPRTAIKRPSLPRYLLVRFEEIQELESINFERYI